MADFRNRDGRSYPNPLEAGFERVITPFQAFIRDQTTASILLLGCTFFALSVDNSPLADDYEALVETPAGLVAGKASGMIALTWLALRLNIGRLPTADCRLPTADCRLPTADCRLPAGGNLQHIVGIGLPGGRIT